MYPDQLSTTLAEFSPISLDELNDRAELLTRVDRKYLLTVREAAVVVATLSATAQVLDFGGVRSSHYTSVYFDTPNHLSYRLAAQSRRRRFKVRTRCYTDANLAYLEMKVKGSRGATVKERINYAASDIDRLTDEASDYIVESLASIGYPGDVQTQLQRALTTRYQRTTLLLRDNRAGNSRATIDTNLEWIDADGRTLALPGYVILESKSSNAPTGLDRGLWQHGHRPANISKFGTGTAALNPQLPSNKWHRLLTGPFATATITASPQFINSL